MERSFINRKKFIVVLYLIGFCFIKILIYLSINIVVSNDFGKFSVIVKKENIFVKFIIIVYFLKMSIKVFV